MLLKKIFNLITPYKRTLLTFKVENKILCTLPAVNTAVYFLSNGDKIFIDSLEGFDEYSYIDYDLISSSNTQFSEEFEAFKNFIKDNLKEDKAIEFIVERKIIYFKKSNYCLIELNLATYGE